MGLFRRNKNNNKPLIRQILDLVPRWLFESCTNTYKAENVFVTRIKSNTKYEIIEELDLPDNIDQHILKDEIIRLTSNKAIETGISEYKLRLVHSL